jgi:tetratricopeptide (TPR) repeat protein
LKERLLQYDFAAATPLAASLLALPHPDAMSRGALYAWLAARDDQAEIDRRTRAMLEAADAAAVDAQAAGRLALELLDYVRAEHLFRRAESLASSDEDRADALRGLGQVAYKRRAFDASLLALTRALALQDSADTRYALADTLIRLGRTEEAISAAERAIELQPLHEQAHYLLGNGYARLNYTELATRDASALQEAAEINRRASAAFDRGDFRAARDLAQQALRRCPGYGRAHAMLAKALEFERFAIDVHRADYEARFAAQTLPVVAGIERYVLNWAELTPRQQKRVALSLAPWRHFIPVLIAGGARHYIKPLWMKLSEVPGMETLKDQRINYDARLWDDVRGAGGYITVTGVEDVERTIFDRYNTVLHEATHQVHGVLTADQAREIQALYQRAKSRDEARSASGDVAAPEVFLSRYAGGSVWEYFAEGANALMSPRRDAYDPRDVVRERLVAMDPDLQALVERYFAMADTRPNLPIAHVGAGNHQLEKGHAAEAVAAFRQALRLAPRDEAVWASFLPGLGFQGDAQARRELPRAAQKALQLHASSGAIQSAVAEALWRAGEPLAKATASLQRQRSQVRVEDRYLVDLALGANYWRLGDAPRALAAYEDVLAYQSDNPEGLWGKAAALALAERWDEAFALYEQVVRLRTGVPELRADYARDLLRAGRIDQARAQLDAARLLDPVHPGVLAVAAWATLSAGDAVGASTQAAKVLEAAPWFDLARLVKATALQQLGNARAANKIVAPLRQRLTQRTPPGYVYRGEVAAWVSVHEMPALERRLLAAIQPASGRR